MKLFKLSLFIMTVLSISKVTGQDLDVTGLTVIPNPGTVGQNVVITTQIFEISGNGWDETVHGPVVLTWGAAPAMDFTNATLGGTGESFFSNLQCSATSCTAELNQNLPGFSVLSVNLENVLADELTTMPENYNAQLQFPFGSVDPDPLNDRTLQFETIEALPIELTRFTVEKQDKVARLKWETKTEVNNDYFGIQTSIDGQIFETIGQVQGGGNSSTGLEYEFIHDRPTVGLNYYRLQQFDFDGKYEYTPIRSLKFNIKSNVEFEYFPNPVFDELSIVTSADEKNLSIHIYNVTGNVVHADAFVNGGIIDMRNLSSGLYVAQIIDASGFVISQGRIIRQ